MKTWLVIPFLLSSLSAALAQQPSPERSSHEHAAVTATASVPQTGRSPYVGMQDRPVKALSPEQTADLLAGHGMALALPAELNGYPGPSHTLELADPLGLSVEQRQQTKQLTAQMKAEAQALGKQLLASEAALDSLFKDRRASSATVTEEALKAAQIQGALRVSHLKYHLAMMALLSPRQVAQYQHLRGYP